MSDRGDAARRARPPGRAATATADPAPWHEDPWDAAPDVDEVEALRPQRAVAKWVGFGALAVGMVLIIGAGWAGWWYVRQANPSGGVGPPVAVDIADGENLHDLSEQLEQAGIVQSASFFRRYVDDHGGLTPAPGLYNIPTGDHVGNVLRVLRTPPSETITRVTFPEGFTLRQMANRLANEIPQFDAASFMNIALNDTTIASLFRPAGVNRLEGLLFPATYDVSNADTERQVIERMVAQMERVARDQEEIDRIAPTLTGANGTVLGLTPYQVLVVASMIEREAKTEQDRPLIARVIYNRLALGMKLQVDATVLYDAPASMLPPAVDDIDVDTLRTMDNPWNTFTRAGLPATPIANPGRASIEAALHPAPDPSPGSALCSDVPADQCMYLYYVLKDEQGNHAFSVTEAQFASDVQYARDHGLTAN
jgi:peptidoglycan lytic transglycosylase G